MDIRLIAIDLDGTLLDSSKNISPENMYALERAAQKGIQIVPCTGRFYTAIPENVRELPFVRYAITINGAVVYDAKEDKVISETAMPLERGLEMLDWCAGLGVAYDCYIGSRGYMLKDHIDHIEDHLGSPVYCQIIRSMRIPVEDLKAFVKAQGLPVQKVQIFSKDRDLLFNSREYINSSCPDLLATSSLNNNLEINAAQANKGTALRALAKHLGLSMKQTMAIGDGGNDLPMILAAGTSAAMANGLAELKKAASFTTLSQNGSGVAYAINRVVL